MKKLMMALAAVAVAASVNAANVMWSAANVYAMGTTTKASGYTAYFLSTENMFNGTTQLAKGYSLENATAQLAAGSIEFLETYSMSDKTITNGAGANTATTGAGNSQSWTGYLVILDGTAATATHAYITPTASKSTGGTGAQATLLFSSNTGTQNASNWYAVGVPEPTSGLLLLLGMAGLALKRKHA